MNAEAVVRSRRTRPDGSWIEPLRLLAKLLGTVPAAIGWVFLIGEAFSEPGGLGVEGSLVLACLVLLTAAALLTWHHARHGALAEIAAAFAFGAVVFATAGSNRVAVALLLPLPWLLSGLALLLLGERQGAESSDDASGEE